MLTLGRLRFQLHFYIRRYTLFLSFKVVVRACCDSAVDFTGTHMVSVDVVVVFKIEVTSDFYVTKQRISTSWGVCRLLGCARRAPSAALRLLALSPRQIQTVVSYLFLKPKSPPVSRRRSLIEGPCHLQSCPAAELCPTQETDTFDYV